MLPQLLCALSMIVYSIAAEEGCGDVLLAGFIFGLLYPLVVPAVTIYQSLKILCGDKDKYDWLTFMKGFKIFEHLGQYFLFIIL